MSSSPTTTTDSPSPSPSTPEPSIHTDSVAVQADLDAVAAWYTSMHQTTPDQDAWNSNPPGFEQAHKVEDEQMLRIDELLEQHAFDDGATHHFPSLPSPQHTDSYIKPFLPNFRPNNLLVPSLEGPISATNPVSPPASLPRKPDSLSQRVVHPPKESCFNLPIMFPSIPEGGTKSRVETQVRITVDLADATSPSDTCKYDRVGSWKWLKLPSGTSTKRRTRKQGKIDATPQDTLSLMVEVVCASAPTVPVVSCTSCRTREAKRVAKKIAARVRPARSESESAGEDLFGKPVKKLHHEDTNSIVQFNCAETLDFSTGSVVLPLRITCYCRHHREKVGFLVRFTMIDHVGRVVGLGISKPIMITDDHKTASASSRQTDYVNTFSGVAVEHDWSQASPVGNDTSPSDLRAPSRRKDKAAASLAKKRPKPYDSSSKPGRGSREGSVVSSLPSPSTVYSPLPGTRSPTPSVLQNLLSASEVISQLPSQTQTPSIPSLQPSTIQSPESSSPDLLTTPLDHNSDAQMPDIIPYPEHPESANDVLQVLSQMHQTLQQPQLQSIPQDALMMPQPQPSLPFMFFEPTSNGQNMGLQIPTIHRLIPNMGPTYGGIEVTVLGANFNPSLNLRCVFGDVVASSTQRWSDNTLVCVLPPRAQPGVVAVWFEGMMDQSNTLPSLFTYSDESARALMELALQVVGLKMTGRVEDAKDVAMRIVGANGGGNNDSSGNNSSQNIPSNMMHLTNNSTISRDLRPLLSLIQPGETEDFESIVLNFLAVLDTPLSSSNNTSSSESESETATYAPNAISTSDALLHTTPTGQTLLHLASFMGLQSLVEFLVQREADVDARDKNGFTALHFASLRGSEECVRILVEVGRADREVVDAAGRTAEEVGPTGLFEALDPLSLLREREDGGHDGDVEENDEDEEAAWGDAEEENEEMDGGDAAKIRKLLKKRASLRRIAVNSSNAPGRGTPRRSHDISRSTTPLPPSSEKSQDAHSPNTISSEKTVKDVVDTKQTAASFVEMIQRTFAQLPPAGGIIPNIPNLPKPQLPGLPGLPGLPDFVGMGMPWGVGLPQIPMVFPIFVPTPAWPSFFGGSDESSGKPPNGKSEPTSEDATENIEVKAPTTIGAGGKAAQEMRAFWERWFALAIAVTAKQHQEQQAVDMPPPQYTPRVADNVTTPTPTTAVSSSSSAGTAHKGKGTTKALIPAATPLHMGMDILHETPAVAVSSGSTSSSRSHPVGYDDTPVPAEEVDAYTYQPPKQKQKHKKHDRMLLLFWLPILLLSMIWAAHYGIRFVYQTLWTNLPLKAYLRQH